MPNSKEIKIEAFVTRYIANGYNAADAARTVTDSENTNYLAVVGNRYINKPEVKKLLEESLGKTRMTREEAIEIIADKIRAVDEDKLSKDNLNKFLLTYERFTRTQAEMDKERFQHDLEQLLKTGDLLEEFMEGETEEFEKVFSPRLENGRMIFDIKKKTWNGKKGPIDPYCGGLPEKV